MSSFETDQVDPVLSMSPDPIEVAPSTTTHGSAVDHELERIAHYQDTMPRVPEYMSWGAHRLRSSTLDKADDFISDRPLGLISNASLPSTDNNTTWDIEIEGDVVKNVSPHDPARIPPEYTNSLNAGCALLAPSLCHPHVHLDKAFLLSHPRHSHLRVQQGSFEEAMDLTGKAKANFTSHDIFERGQRLIDESIAAGVTHIRAFVELDIVVGTKCLEAALLLKRNVERCGIRIQVCAFAQLPLFSTAQQDHEGAHIRKLLTHAASLSDVEVVGSTPYVEDDEQKMQHNIEWITQLAVKANKHLDFHLDYNLDPQAKAMVWQVLDALKSMHWQQENPQRTIVLGHCSRLTLFDDHDWHKLREAIGALPLSFVGLPTSDLFMLRSKNKTLGTLNVPRLIKAFDFNACVGINNIGNAFTPNGSCDPLSLTSMGVSIYQAATESDAELLYECISTRARSAIGLGRCASSSAGGQYRLSIRPGDPADFLLFGSDHMSHWRTRRSVSEAIYLHDGIHGRRLCVKGRLVSG